MKTMINPHISSQQGVGLIEVLVSLLLLAVAILGFSAMQLRAMEATDESMIRNRALTIMRGGGEMMRSNPPIYKQSFHQTLNLLYRQNIKDSTYIERAHKATEKKCLNKICNPNQLANKDADYLAYTAQQSDVKIRMEKCPGTDTLVRVTVDVPDKDDPSKTKPQNIDIKNVRRCLIASWGDTEPVIAGHPSLPSGKLPCLTKKNKYQNGATCFVMETY